MSQPLMNHSQSRKTLETKKALMEDIKSQLPATVQKNIPSPSFAGQYSSPYATTTTPMEDPTDANVKIFNVASNQMRQQAMQQMQPIMQPPQTQMFANLLASPMVSEHNNDDFNNGNLSSFCSIPNTPILEAVNNNSKKMSIQNTPGQFGTPAPLFQSPPHQNMNFADVERFFLNSNGMTPIDPRMEISPYSARDFGGRHQMITDNGAIVFNQIRRQKKDDSMGCLKLTPVESPADALKNSFNQPISKPHHRANVSLDDSYTKNLTVGMKATSNAGDNNAKNMMYEAGSNQRGMGNPDTMQMQSSTMSGGGQNMTSSNIAQQNMSNQQGQQQGQPISAFDMSNMMTALSKLSINYKNMPGNMVFLSKVSQIPKIGAYTKEERLSKIQKYKNKLKCWRLAHPVKRKFTGRSKAAVEKPRLHGRFVKMAEQGKQIKKANGGADDQVNDLLTEFDSKL